MRGRVTEGGSGQGGGGGGETPEPTRTRIPLWKALGTEQQLKDGKSVWVMFSDAIARIALEGPWSVRPSRTEAPFMLGNLSEIDSCRQPVRGQYCYVLGREGVIAFERDGKGATVRVADAIVTGEHVEPHDDPHHQRCSNDIVRVTR